MKYNTIRKIISTSLILLSALIYSQEKDSIEYKAISPDLFRWKAITYLDSMNLSNQILDSEKQLKIWAGLIETSPKGREFDLAAKGMYLEISKRNDLLKRLEDN